MPEAGQEVHPDGTLAFELVGVSLRFGQNYALRDLNLKVRAGEHVAVIGPSGAGKTTMLRLMAAILKPTEGRVDALGYDTSNVHGRNLRELRRRIGFVYQNDNLIPQLRVVHNVLMGRLPSWFLPKALLSLLWPQELMKARDALREVELEDRLWSQPDELSGGQQQRVAIARLLVQRPEVILADEPVSQLDMRLGREVVQLLKQVATRESSTLLVNLHSLDLLQGNFQRVVALRQGRLMWQGTPREINRDILHELYGAEYRALHLDELALEPQE
ncbi:MAG: ATP-binding cassette domain-containing protein [Planctomycetes bacterium]|nr:ATP-binding cassette domain-containing protein [Planctomycetota bacterium]